MWKCFNVGLGSGISWVVKLSIVMWQHCLATFLERLTAKSCEASVPYCFSAFCVMIWKCKAPSYRDFNFQKRCWDHCKYLYWIFSMWVRDLKILYLYFCDVSILKRVNVIEAFFVFTKSKILSWNPWNLSFRYLLFHE